MIINSLLDTDMYKFYMGQYAWKYYPDVKVKFAFTNRTTSIKLTEHININQLQDQLFHVSKLRFTFEELQYLKGLKIFSDDYLNFLNTLQLPPVYVETKNMQLVIETTGKWKEVLFWETFILSIINELYNNIVSNNRYLNYMASGIKKKKLEEKIQKIKKHPFKFSDFGTRRRFSHDWQNIVLSTLKIKVPDSLLGTSNVYFAKKLELKPIGTFAHELPMIVCGINPHNLKAYHRQALRQWYKLYGEDLSIALTDTYGTDFFFKEGIDHPENWKGLRQDSGDPFEFVKKALKYYYKHKIDSREKSIVFSDGLDIDKIIDLEKVFKKQIKLVYGWGTNLTNDCGIEPLSIVVKAVEADAYPLVKLSDNLAKAIGEPKILKRYKKEFGYSNTYNKSTKY